MLANLRILVVEDELLIALDLADEIAARGGIVVGPAHSVSEALALIVDEPPDVAILDAMLPDNDISPVGRILAEGRVPYILYTGTGLPPGLAETGYKPPVVMKPLSVETAVDRLEELLRNHDFI